MEDKNKLTGMIRDITLHYVKFYYDKYLKEQQKNILLGNEVIALVDNLYDEKQQGLRKYIRETLKTNLQEQYPKLLIENILMEMFQDRKYAKQRVVDEIIMYQKSK